MNIKKIIGSVGAILAYLLFDLSSLVAQEWKPSLDSANIYVDKKDLKTRINFYLKVKNAIQKDSVMTMTYADLCDSLALLYSVKREFEKAEPLYINSIKIREILSKDSTISSALTYHRLGLLYLNKSELAKAEELFLKANGIREAIKGKYSQGYAVTCIDLGMVYYYQHKIDQAEYFFEEGIRIGEKTWIKTNGKYDNGLYLVLGTAQNNLGVIYDSKKWYDKAEQIYKNCRDSWITINRIENYLIVCHNLSVLYEQTFQFDKVESIFLEMIKTYEENGKISEQLYLSSLSHIAKNYDLMGQFNKSFPYYLRVEKLEDSLFGKSSKGYLYASTDLACHYQQTGQLGNAGQLFKEIVDISEHLNALDSSDYALYLMNLGSYFQNSELCDTAISLYLRASDILKRNKKTSTVVYIHCEDNLASCYEQKRMFAKANMVLLEVKNITTPELTKNIPLFRQLSQDRAHLYWNMGKPEDAEREYSEALSIEASNVFSFFLLSNERDKNIYLRNIIGEDDDAFSFIISQAKLNSILPLSIAHFHRNLILGFSQNLRKVIFSSNDSVLIRKYDQWLIFKSQISRYYSSPSLKSDSNISEIEYKADSIERDLSSQFKKMKSQLDLVDEHEIQKHLRNDDASVEFVSFKYNNGYRITDSIFYMALILKKEEPYPLIVKLFEKKQLDTILARFKSLPSSKKINELYGSNHLLYNLIWKPLERHLKGVHRIYYALAGDLFKLSFSAIPLGNHQVLSDKYKLIQLNSTAELTENLQCFINSKDRIQVYGGIKYDADSLELSQASIRFNEKSFNSTPTLEVFTRDESFHFLPGTFEEVKEIERLASSSKNPINTLAGAFATEESFKALNGKYSPEILHIATHGFFFPDKKIDSTNGKYLRHSDFGIAFKQSDNPLFRSGLVFAGANHAWIGKPIAGMEDGLLTAYEVANMYLPNTKLVVLSACETALGEIRGYEGVYGLQRSFKLSGVQFLVMSLWKVKDAETAEFMKLMYRALFTHKSIIIAFYQAQKIMKEKYKSEPYKWAGWVLVR